MFVNEGKIKTSRFFPMLHHEESPEKPQNNTASHPLHFSLAPPLPHFCQFGKFQTFLYEGGEFELDHAHPKKSFISS